MTAPAAPAGFLHRYAAWSLDAGCIALLAVLAAWPWVPAAWRAVDDATVAFFAAAGRGLHDAFVAGAGPMQAAWGLAGDAGLQLRMEALRAALLSLVLPWLLGYVLVAFGWHAGGVASRWQGSPGKRAFGLQVATRTGGRPGPGRAMGRHLAAGLSWLTLNVGHLLALGTGGSALHDRIAGTRVLRRDGRAGLPRLALAWLVVQVAGALVLLAWLPQAARQLVLAGLP